jgi:hypothetical protein
MHRPNRGIDQDFSCPKLLIFNHESARRNSADLLDAIIETLAGHPGNGFDSVIFTTNLMDPDSTPPGQPSSIAISGVELTHKIC